jgi:hypothetical protein
MIYRTSIYIYQTARSHTPEDNNPYSHRNQTKTHYIGHTFWLISPRYITHYLATINTRYTTFRALTVLEVLKFLRNHMEQISSWEAIFRSVSQNVRAHYIYRSPIPVFFKYTRH